MAGDNLESRLILRDEASEVLKEVAAQSEKAGEALEVLEDALKSIEAVGEIEIKTDISASNVPKSKPANAPDSVVDAEILPQAVAECVQETVALLDETQNMIHDASSAIKDMEKELNEADSIDISALEAFNARNQERWEQLQIELEESAENILQEWEDAENNLLEVPGEIEQAAEDTGREVKKGVRGLGADIAGWWSIIKDVFDKIADVFGKMAEESDKLNTRMARFGLVADAEGKKGADRSARGSQLYAQHQKFAQALGVQSESFNETVLNMYSNGAGVVKSIEDAQKIAASSYMAMDIAGLRGDKKDAVMGEIQSMISVGIADPDQIQESMKIAPNILRTIEKQWQKNLNGKAFKLKDGKEITDATGKIAVLAQEGQITAELVSQAMINSAQETNKVWQTLPSTWEKLGNRIRTITENITFDIIKSFGELADDPQVASFVVSALNFGEKLIAFTKEYIIPVIGGALRVIGSILGTIFDGLSHWQTAIPIIASIGMAMTAVAMKTGLLTKAIAGVKGAFMAISANPLILVAGAAIIATLAIAHLVRTTQTGQELMLQATANIAYSFQQVGAVISNLYGIGQWVFSRLAMIFQSFVVGILEGLEFALEKLSKVSDTAKDMLASVRAEQGEWTKSMADMSAWGDEGLDALNKELEDNTKFFYEYSAKIPEMAKANLANPKDELKLTGFLEDILKGQQNAPGHKNNPAHVKGKVGIDGEYFDIIKRAAGVEIVNRYTTLRPTVHAQFGDIHQVDAKDIIGELGKQIQDAEGAAISDAQAMGA